MLTRRRKSSVAMMNIPRNQLNRKHNDNYNNRKKKSREGKSTRKDCEKNMHISQMEEFVVVDRNNNNNHGYNMRMMRKHQSSSIDQFPIRMPPPTRYNLIQQNASIQLTTKRKQPLRSLHSTRNINNNKLVKSK